MSLIIGRNNSFIAKEDLIVYKQLKKISKNKYVTPVLEYPVFLNNYLVPEEILFERPHGFKNKITKGAINAFTYSEYNPKYPYFRAIIKKGTRFWIQDDLEEIAAESLYITNELAGYEETDFSDYIKYCGVDVLLKSGKRCKLVDSFRRGHVIGIYAYGDQVINLRHKRLQLSETYPLVGGRKNYDDYSEANRNMNGYESTNLLRALYFKSEALEYCNRIGENWYIPSLGQLTMMSKNLLCINFTLKYLRKERIQLYKHFWSSSLVSPKYAWICYNSGNHFCTRLNFYNVRQRFSVIPFLKQ